MLVKNVFDNDDDVGLNVFRFVLIDFIALYNFVMLA